MESYIKWESGTPKATPNAMQSANRCIVVRILLCFAVSSPASLKNVIDKSFLEADASSPTLQKVLVGMKAHLRENRHVLVYLAQKRLKLVSYCQGLNATKELGCVLFGVQSILSHCLYIYTMTKFN